MRQRLAARCAGFAIGRRERFETVRSQLPEPLRPPVTLMYLTGWRISEVLRLQWRHVDFTAGRVTLDPGTTKNRKGRVFPFTAELRELFESQRERTRAVERAQDAVIPHVFHRNGRPIKSFYGAWRTACEQAGCPARIPHDFRRTAIRNVVRAGVPERVAMELSGSDFWAACSPWPRRWAADGHSGRHFGR